MGLCWREGSEPWCCCRKRPFGITSFTLPADSSCSKLRLRSFTSLAKNLKCRWEDGAFSLSCVCLKVKIMLRVLGYKMLVVQKMSVSSCPASVCPLNAAFHVPWVPPLWCLL